MSADQTPNGIKQFLEAAVKTINENILSRCKDLPYLPTRMEKMEQNISGMVTAIKELFAKQLE